LRVARKHLLVGCEHRRSRKRLSTLQDLAIGHGAENKLNDSALATTGFTVGDIPLTAASWWYRRSLYWTYNTMNKIS